MTAVVSDAPAEQPGVLATLSRWRSWVQIPSGALRRSRSSHRDRHGTQTGKAALLKPRCLWVRLPLVPARIRINRGWCSSRQPVKPLPLNSEAEARGSTPPPPIVSLFDGPVVYRQGHRPLTTEKGVRLPSGLLKCRGVDRQDRHPNPGVAGAPPALIKPAARLDTGAWDSIAGGPVLGWVT